MRGTVPLLGVFTGLASPPTSRVPHLIAHILSRQSRGLPRTDHRNRRPFRHGRSFKSSSGSQLEVSRPRKSSPELLANAFDETINTSHAVDREDRNEAHQASGDVEGPGCEACEASYDLNTTQEVTPAIARMRSLMAEGHPETLRFALRSNPLTDDFIRTADDATFTEALQLLDAESLFGEYKHVYSNVTRPLTTHPIYRSIRKLEQRLYDFACDMDRIWHLRRGAGHKLCRDACKVLLRTAAFMGDGPRALHVSDEIMLEDGVQPDLECFNLLMEAVCWNHAFSQAERRDLRVTAGRLENRRAGNPSPPLRLSGHKVASSAEPELKLGLRAEILTAFRKVVAAGLQGDEATFTHVMTAMGREGDLPGVKSILKSVWNVDVDMLSVYDEEEIEGPTFYDEGSPLRPSARLLFTIVHVFGSNNQVGAAFALVDYISRNYNLPIIPRVWFELCGWTRIASCFRSQAQKRKGEAVGQVDWRVFEKLWQVMTDEPHNLAPDVPLLSRRYGNFRRARTLDDGVESIRHMKVRLAERKEIVVKLYWEMMKVIQNSQVHDAERPLSVEFLDKRHEYIIASQKYDRDLQLVNMAVRQMFHWRHWSTSRKTYEWATRRLPVLLAEFGEGAPNNLQYHTPTGLIQFVFEADRTAIWQTSRMMPESHFHDTTWLGIMRKLLDHADHELVWQRVQSLLPGGSIRTVLAENTDSLAQAVDSAMLGQSQDPRHLTEGLSSAE